MSSFDDLEVAQAWKRAQLDDHYTTEFLPISADALDLDTIRLSIESVEHESCPVFWMAEDVLDMCALIPCLHHFGIDKQLQHLLPSRLLFGWRRQQLIHSVKNGLVVVFRHGRLGKPRLTLL